jgi:hypothetical protein
MRVRVLDPRLTDDLVRFLSGNDCLAVKRGRDTVDVAPIAAVSERYDRRTIEGYVREWTESGGGGEAEIITRR